MSSHDWNKLLIDRGMMTTAEVDVFYKKSSIYYQRCTDAGKAPINRYGMEPFFGEPELSFCVRKRRFLAFRHPSIVNLIRAISNERPEIVPWFADQHIKNSLVISQPHNGTFFAKPWMGSPLGNYASPILKLLSSHTEVLSIYSASGDDPCSYQRWEDGKCVRAIEYVPNNDGLGEVVDFGKDKFNDPTYEKRPWYMDVNRALEASGHAGHLIPPRKSRDEEVLAWKVYMPDILK